MARDVKNLIMYWIEGEISNFIKVWLSAYTSLFYCYLAGKLLTKGFTRLAAFLPVVVLFLLLPLQLHTMHLGGTTSFFLAWLTNFKLLMLAFDKGPLSHPSIPFIRFLAVACLPIKLTQRNPIEKSKETGQILTKTHKPFLNYAIKGVLLSLAIKIYSYEDRIHPRLINVLYCIHVYLSLELTLAIAASMARLLLGVELEPQFNEPYLSSSLQDFWGHRWNLMVTRILRPTVYIPVRNWSSRLVGQDRVALPAVMATFLVSGLMHELMFYYLGRAEPTWEVTFFFVLHGGCLMVEISVKNAMGGRWALPRAVRTVLTVGFVVVTGSWLFFPQLLRFHAEKKGLAELTAVGDFVKDVVGAFGLSIDSSPS